MKSALRERLRAGSPDPDTGKLDGVDRLPEFEQYVATAIMDGRAARDAQFNEKLRRFAEIAASVFKHRVFGQMVGPDGRPLPTDESAVFTRSNHSLQIVRSVMKFLLARVYKDLFGSRPWLSASPQPDEQGTASVDEKQTEASQIQKHGEYKLDEAQWQEKNRGVLQTALELGLCFVKTTWDERWDVSETLQSILLDPDGQPIGTRGTVNADGSTTGGGEHIVPEDDTQRADGQPEADGDTPDPTAPRVFTKDPSVPVPDETNKLQFKPHLVEDKERLFCGLDYSPLHWKDVVFPINAAELDIGRGDCPFIGVTRDMTLEEIRQAYDPDGTNEELKGILEQLKSGQTTPQSEAANPKQERGEPMVKGSDPENPVVKITECYFRRRVLPTGPESRIFLVLAEGLDKAVYIEYLSALSPRAQAPIHCVAVNRVPGRIYGIGLIETFEMAANLLDKLINCILLRNEEHANPDRFIDSKLHEQLEGGKIFKGPGVRQPVNNNTGLPLGQMLFTDEYPDLDTRTWQLVELVMQLIQIETGVTNASQGDASDLPSNTTATGINSMLESSSVLHQFVLGEIRDGLTPPLRYGIELLYFMQDHDESYGAGVMTYQKAQDLKNLRMNVQILLSRAKRQEMREAIFAAIPQAATFYQYPPQIQKRVRKLFVDAFQTLGLDNPEQYFPLPQEIDASIQAQQEQAGQSTPEERVSLRENMNYPDVPPSIQRQMERGAGFTPTSDEEAAAWQASKQAEKAKGKPAPSGDNEGPAGQAAPNEEQEPPQAGMEAA